MKQKSLSQAFKLKPWIIFITSEENSLKNYFVALSMSKFFSFFGIRKDFSFPLKDAPTSAATFFPLFLCDF